jgi:hypothetical protein
MGEILDPCRTQREVYQKEAEKEKHPPAPGGHIQEELHEGQQVVVVVRHPGEGTAQWLELWGQGTLVGCRRKPQGSDLSLSPFKELGGGQGQPDDLQAVQCPLRVLWGGLVPIHKATSLPSLAILGCSPRAGAGDAGGQS